MLVSIKNSYTKINQSKKVRIRKKSDWIFFKKFSFFFYFSFFENFDRETKIKLEFFRFYLKIFGWVILDRLRTQNYYINSVHGDWPTANLKLGAPLLRTFCSQWLFAAISEILYRRSDFVSGKFNDLYKVKLTPRP